MPAFQLSRLSSFPAFQLSGFPGFPGFPGFLAFQLSLIALYLLAGWLVGIVLIIIIINKDIPGIIIHISSRRSISQIISNTIYTIICDSIDTFLTSLLLTCVALLFRYHQLLLEAWIQIIQPRLECIIFCIFSLTSKGK